MSETPPETTLTIPRVTVLKGHTDPDSAYVVDDYPYGRTLRCKIRYWVETGTRKYKGAQRFVRQTTNPKAAGEVWNKPHTSTYSRMVTLYLDEDGHVQWHGVHSWVTGPEDARLRAMGIFDAFTEDEHALYGALLTASQKLNPRSWDEWYQRVAELADRIKADGCVDLDIVNSTWTAPDGRLRYLSDPAAYVNAAWQLI